MQQLLTELAAARPLLAHSRTPRNHKRCTCATGHMMLVVSCYSSHVWLWEDTHTQRWKAHLGSQCLHPVPSFINQASSTQVNNRHMLGRLTEHLHHLTSCLNQHSYCWAEPAAHYLATGRCTADLSCVTSYHEQAACASMKRPKLTPLSYNDHRVITLLSLLPEWSGD